MLSSRRECGTDHDDGQEDADRDRHRGSRDRLCAAGLGADERDERRLELVRGRVNPICRIDVLARRLAGVVTWVAPR